MMKMNKKILLAVTIASLPFVPAGYAQDMEMMERGEQVFDTWCGICHGEPANPGDMIGTQTLRERYEGTSVPALLEERTNMAPAFIENIVRNGISMMPFFRKTEISEEELDALSAYLTRNNP